MKKFLLLFCLFPLISYSQTCDWITNNTDAFNENNNFYTKRYDINKMPENPYYFSWSLSYVEFEYGNYENLLHVELTTKRKNFFSNAGEKLLLKLNNGHTVIFRNGFTSGTNFNAFDGVAWTDIRYSFIISEDMLQQIEEVGISDMRLHTHGSYYDTNLTPTDNKAIANMIKCYLSNIPLQ